MELAAATAPLVVPPAAAPAYPTLGESWGILGWYLLVTLVVGGAFYAVLSTATAVPKHLLVLGSTVVANFALLFFLRWKAGARWQPWQLGGQAPWWLYAALPVVVVASIVVLSLLSYLHLPNSTSKLFEGVSRTPAVAVVLGGVAAPVLEELLFRGVVLNGLLARYRPWVAIGQSALLFGVFHLNPAQSVSAGLLGLLVGWLYYRTRSLAVCIGLHALNNTLAFVAMRYAPAAWQKDSLAEGFGSNGAYAGAVLAAVAVLAALLWAVQRATAPPAPAPAPETA